jgi:predicted dehydrogenase
VAKKQLRVGVIGYGFMGRAHSNAYRQVTTFFPSDTQVVLKAACARDAAKTKAFADQWGYESTETDWRKLVERKDVDAVDVCVPNNLHAEIALAAAAAGKAILCEKPLAMTGPEGKKMVETVEKAKVPNIVWYNYRRIPAVTLAKRLVDEGRLGKVFHYRAKFLQDWTIKADLPQGGQGLWRLDLAAAGAGVSGDLLAHCIDTAVWMNGRMENVCAQTETFVKERMHTLTGKVEKVGIDDACTFFGTFANGSLANFESTRYARGHKALYTFEINGENMSLFWDLHDLHRLQVFDYKDEGKTRGWKSVHVTDNSPDHPYMDKWWVPGLAIGYDASFTHTVADFVKGMETGNPAGPTFRDALETQYILDAVLSSAKDRQWKTVQKV